MPFAFNNVLPDSGGRVSQADIPLGDFISTSFLQGVHDSAFSSVMRMREMSLYDDGEILSPDEANKQFRLPGLVFDEPVRAGRARIMYRRKEDELQRMYTIGQGNPDGFFSRRNLLAGLPAQMLGNLSNPLDLGLTFLPVVGSEKAAMEAVTLGRGMLRQKIARGLMPLESLGSRAPRLTSSLIQGTVQALATEVPHVFAAMEDHEEYGVSDALVNVVAGAAFSAAIHAAVSSAEHIFKHISVPTKEAMIRRAVDDFANGKDIRVDDIARVDENLIHETVKFDRKAARAIAIQEIDNKIDEITAIAKASVEMEGKVGDVSEEDLVKIAQQQIVLRTASGIVTKVEQKLLERVLNGERDPVTLQNLASQFNLEYEPLAKFPEHYRDAPAQRLIDPREFQKVEPRSITEKLAIREQLQNAQEQQLSRAVQAERKTRIEDMVRRMSEEHEAKQAAAKLDTAVRDGTVLTDKQLKENTHESTPAHDGGLAKIDEDIESLKKDLGIEEKSSEEQEKSSKTKQLDEGLKSRHSAIDEALKCLRR